ncbi:MAG: hypothetical protein II891_00015 [Bacteroidales bacterium]|nr:hypothetical protein [Bacteroidales bacterium]
MFDHESSAVREGIEFLEQLLENDFREDSSFDPDDLRERLEEIEADVRELVANLPYEAIDDDDEREYQHPDMFDDSEELEDEIVECDALVDRALELLAEVEAIYFPPEEAPAPAQSEPSPGRDAAEPAAPAGSVSVSPTPKAAARMAARKAERRKEARKSWLQVLLVLAGIALALLLFAISSD